MASIRAIIVIISLLGLCRADINSFAHPGGLHTIKQLESIKSNSEKEPLKQACKQLLDNAHDLLEKQPSPTKDYNVPYFYFNKEKCMTAKQELSNDAFAAYTLAIAYHLETSEKRELYATKAVEIINAWAHTNKKISGFDGDLTACYCGVPLVLASELMYNYPGWDKEDRIISKKWVENTILKSSNSIKRKNNNHGCWGLYTSLVCNHYLEKEDEFEADVKLFEKQISSMIDANGQLPAENKRTNSGMWYTYFALCPMSCSATIATNVTNVDYFKYTDDDGKGLKLALDALFQYCKEPDKWPYEKPTGLKGSVHNLFYPSADYVKEPRPDSWPGNLYEAMNGHYSEEEWNEWLKPHRPIQSGRGWLWATVFSSP